MFPQHRLLPPLCGLDSPLQSYHATQVQSSSATSGINIAVVAGLFFGQVNRRMISRTSRLRKYPTFTKKYFLSLPRGFLKSGVSVWTNHARQRPAHGMWRHVYRISVTCERYQQDG